MRLPPGIIPGIQHVQENCSCHGWTVWHHGEMLLRNCTREEVEHIARTFQAVLDERSKIAFLFS